LRATGVKVLSVPAQEDDAGAADEQPAGGNAQNDEPQNQQAQQQGDGRSGTLLGTVTAKGQGWIAIRPDGERESYKFQPRWIGGTPKQGGGFDRVVLQAMVQAPVGARVQAQWVRDGQIFYLLSLKPAPEEPADGGDAAGN
jgi:hypothetical protein